MKQRSKQLTARKTVFTASKKDIHNILARNLTELRKQAGLTQYEVADLLHISRQAYSSYENNRRSPDICTWLALSKIFNVSLNDLLLPDELT